MGAADRTRNSIRQARQARGLDQQELAERIGLSRQALSAIESGGATPSTAVALRLSAVLDRPVDRLFWLEPRRATAEVALAQAARTVRRGRGPRRLVLGEVEGRRVGHPLAEEDFALADGLLPHGGGGGRVQLLRAPEDVAENVLVSGCDPAIALLAARLADRHPGRRLAWIDASSLAALGALARGEVHVAGAHLEDEASGEFNVAFVRRLFPRRRMTLVNLARWEEGLLVRRADRRRIKGVVDLARRGVRLINREPGSGARALLDRALERARVPRASVEGYRTVAQGHAAVARSIAAGGADVGVATRAAARLCDLHFVPLSEERFDLVFPTESQADPRVARLLETLDSPAFRAELGTLEGYATRQSGHRIAEVM